MADRLDAGRIEESVLPSLRSQLRKVTVLDEVDSTNLELARMPAAEQHAHAVLAERQTSGRGRRARRWHSPAGGNVYLSLGWCFQNADHQFSTLPLLAAVATAGALKKAGLDGHGIKWPNDILVGGRKLAGILVELKSTGGDTTAAIGIGINVRMPVTDGENPAELIDRPWTDLETHLDESRRPCDRNGLIVALLNQLIASLGRFEKGGFESFRESWAHYDLLEHGQVTLELEGETVNGIAQGVNSRGELMLLGKDGLLHAFHAGEVRVYRGVRAF